MGIVITSGSGGCSKVTSGHRVGDCLQGEITVQTRILVVLLSLLLLLLLHLLLSQEPTGRRISWFRIFGQAEILSYSLEILFTVKDISNCEWVCLVGCWSRSLSLVCEPMGSKTGPLAR